ncbi:circadian transcriptional repressor C1orf51-like [Scleropages formosus]|nr:circadian-associated transcriptional repressor isoform X2 [Scleropages formosus]XP_018592311.1 circadian-associated transcriptional repressor isoform X2 [Scleropages formosus]XP_018592320.1 circadian-associated transcriptional repressor isoform X2 [Scleropages formosus]KPP62039.1 circadian transcriptional repressor C1orf51-like [Scleropages formosus]
MQSSGSTSSQPSHDSLCSSDSFLFSDADHTEDDADVFLSEGDSRESQASREGESGQVVFPQARADLREWACDGFGSQDESEVIGHQVTNTINGTARSSLVTSSSSALNKEKGRGGQTKGDLLFAQKCAELQGFVRPLLELLNGLKKGRFDKGLSSFQQSVAMDRIQRIVGVLQKPTIGERYLHTLLQVEMMLKLWFPHVSQKTSVAINPQPPLPHNLPQSTPPHKHKDQLHIPVKKRKLSWSDTDATPPPALCKSFRQMREEEEGGDGGSKGVTQCHSAVSASVQREISPANTKKLVQAKEEEVGDGEGESSSYKAIHWSEPSLTWVHVAPILSPTKSCPSHEGSEGQKGNSASLMTRGSPATQDNSISSTTQFSDAHHLSFQQCQQVECQSELATADGEGKTSKTCQGRSLSRQPLRKPLNSAVDIVIQSST